jgi:hypothetical protein
MPDQDDDILTGGLDLESGARDIQAISSADAVTAFFARLGYNTNARLKQTPANLGMAAEGTSRPIRNVELIADHEGLLQVYLFELTDVFAICDGPLALSITELGFQVSGHRIQKAGSRVSRFFRFFRFRMIGGARVAEAPSVLREALNSFHFSGNSGGKQ